MSKSKSLSTEIAAYWEVNKALKKKKVNSNLTTSLFKYTFPGMGFELSSNSQNRLHPKDKAKALKFAETIKVNNKTSNLLLEAQEKVFNNNTLTSTNKRHQRKVLSDFIKWLKVPEAIKEKKSKSKLTPVFVREKVVDRSLIYEHRQKTVRSSPKVILSLSEADYQGNKEKISKEIKRIKTELEEYEDFLLTGYLTFKKIRKDTASIRIKHLKTLYGWLYTYKKIPLEQIGFDYLIKVFDLNIDIEDFDNVNDFYIAKGKLESQAKKEAQNTVSILEEFFNNYGSKDRSNSSKTLYIYALVILAKFLYKDITDVNWAENYEDIPVVRRLRIYSRQKTTPNNQKIKPELMTWDIVIKVLEEMRRRADLVFCKSKSQNCLKKSKRKKHHIAADLQRFLCLGLMTLIPPSRSRVIRELLLQDTFKHGLFIGNSFIPKDKLDDPKTAKYYIHLQPKDYKTGESYGEWRGEFPDVKFKDGKTFYSYLDRWIYQGEREIFLKDKEHDFLFLQIISGKPYLPDSFCQFIKAIFNSATGEKVSPHKLRAIFRTYLVNKGASEVELESAAYWMRHSSKTAKEIYTKQTLDEKLTPGVAIASKLNAEILDSIT